MTPDVRPVLIVTQQDYDLHAAAVAEELGRRSVPVIYWDPGTIPLHPSWFALRREAPWRVGGPTSYSIDARMKTTWIRRPTPILLSPDLDPAYSSVVKEEWKSFLTGIWDALDTGENRIVSHPAAIRRAEIKTIQLSIAEKLQLNVPDTIVTNDYEQFLGFFEMHAGAVVCKKLRSHQIIHGDGSAAIFVTKSIDNVEMIGSADLALCPVIFQERVAIRFDCRIIVIGDEVLAFKIHSRESSNAQLDYRASADAIKHMKHEHYTPPDDVISKCRELLKAFNLNFGALDFAIDGEGKHIFLELNPNGQWLWLQIATGFPIADRFATYLSSADTEPLKAQLH